MKLSDLLTDQSRKLFQANGRAYIRELGATAVHRVVFDVMCGKNLRDSTETLTRQRIADLNLAILLLFLKGVDERPDFIYALPTIAKNTLAAKGASKIDRWIAQWILGLTDKGIQNVLRSNPENLNRYFENYVDVLTLVNQKYKDGHGELMGKMQVGENLEANINWEFLTYLFSAIGAQTMAIRGSDKAVYGKIFEKLILGSLLHILGFSYSTVDTPSETEHVFWLSARGDKRESDATALYQNRFAIRFDIGFIGAGNTEVSLDKVSRFERALQFKDTKYSVTTRPLA